jgi:predicted ribosome quality control (RQC) complex YloA/Tae2 family protein
MVLPSFPDIMQINDCAIEKYKEEESKLHDQLLPLTETISKLEQELADLQNKFQEQRKQLLKTERALVNEKQKSSLLAQEKLIFNEIEGRNEVLNLRSDRRQKLKWLEKRKSRRKGEGARTKKRRLEEWEIATSILGGEKLDDLIDLWLQVAFTNYKFIYF